MDDWVISCEAGWLLMGVLGLVAGSFLSVVVYRFPKMLTDTNTLRNGQHFDLWWPGSHCPHCESPLRWWDNLPLLGFLLQRGCCRHCGEPISWRYLGLELGTAALWLFAAVHAGVLPLAILTKALVWAMFSSTLLALAWIDWETLYLPSELTQPLVLSLIHI